MLGGKEEDLDEIQKVISQAARDLELDAQKAIKGDIYLASFLGSNIQGNLVKSTSDNSKTCHMGKAK